MRSIWRGSISFGLVNIPVRLYTASHEKELKFIMLHKKDNSEIRYARMCKTEDKEVPWSEIVKAFEFKKGDFVVLDEEDFKKAAADRIKTIEIINFIEEDEVDSIFYVKPYFLEPDKNASHAYQLLREALKKSKKVGLAKYVLRNREHLAVIKPHNDMLILNELRYSSELVQPKDLEIPANSKMQAKELDIALKLIDQLTVPFKPDAYSDTYTDLIKEMIQRKAKGRPIHPKAAEPAKKSGAKVHDIMSLLKASLDNAPKTKKKSSRAA